MPTILTYPFVSKDESDQTYRPYLPVILTNPECGTTIGAMALLDTGADSCVLPRTIPESTNHKLKGRSVQSSITQGIGKGDVKTWKHTFIIELKDPADKSKTVWKSAPILIDCLDHNNAPVLLGVNHFLSNFKITFDYLNRQIIIEIP